MIKEPLNKNISYIICNDKVPDKSNLKEEGHIFAHSMRSSFLIVCE